MGNSDVESRIESCKKRRVGKSCGSSSAGAAGSSDLLVTLAEAVYKIDTLTDRLKELEHTVSLQAAKLNRLNDSSQEEAENVHDYYIHSDSSKGNISEKNYSYLNGMKRKRQGRRKGCHGVKYPSKPKQGQVNESLSTGSCSSDSLNSSLDMCGRGRCGRHYKVKSGARIKKRPVVKTELWPHTIANEDDGEEVDSENISLAKFISCFTYIIVNCGRAESKGRAALLHAVSSVFECLPWSEARTFHNLIMVKIEQNRVNWSANFPALADNFVDKKIRLSLKSKSSIVTGPSYKVNTCLGKDAGVSRNGFISNKSNSIYSVVCWQWNFSSCTYGENCKRWHVCRTCADAGKLGEAHKASSHDSYSPEPKPGKPRV